MELLSFKKKMPSFFFLFLFFLTGCSSQQKAFFTKYCSCWGKIEACCWSDLTRTISNVNIQTSQVNLNDFLSFSLDVEKLWFFHSFFFQLTDPFNSALSFGQVSFKPSSAAVNKMVFDFDLNLTQIMKSSTNSALDSTNAILLPNGSTIPVSVNAIPNAIMTFQLLNSMRVYVQITPTASFVGVAVVLDELNINTLNMVDRGISLLDPVFFENIVIDGMPVVVGSFFGTTSSTSGFAFFANLTSVLTAAQISTLLHL